MFSSVGFIGLSPSPRVVPSEIAAPGGLSNDVARDKQRDRDFDDDEQSHALAILAEGSGRRKSDGGSNCRAGLSLDHAAGGRLKHGERRA